MSKMTFTQPRATLEETLEFANRVRQAGGGNPLDALMPAVPEDASQCLVAKNLNFNCEVTTLQVEPTGGEPVWVMVLDRFPNTEVRDRIAEELDLEPFDYHYPYHSGGTHRSTSRRCCGVVLPPEIGQVADQFDKWSDALFCGWQSDRVEILPDASKEDIDRLREFWPYVEASVRETYENATFVNDKGEIIL